MRIKNRAVIAVLGVIALISLILPAVTLFGGDGLLAYNIRQPQTVSMMAEVLAVFLILVACLLLIKNTGRKYAAVGCFALAVCYLHVTFLPMLASGVYLLFLILTGRRFRLAALQMGKNTCAPSAVTSLPVDFLIGSSLIITLFCVMSALGVGGVPAFRGTVIFLGVLVFADAATRYRTGKMKLRRGRETRGEEAACGEKGARGEKSACGEKSARDEKGARGGRETPDREDAPDREERPDQKNASGGSARRRAVLPAVLVAFILTMLLIQVARMNITLDFDTLWYGVRSEYILDNGSGIYENPGMVGMAYVYSKGLEVLTLPLCDLPSHSYLLFFGVWLAAMGIFLCYRIGCFFMGRSYALLAAAVVSAVPAILNMSISAKPDIITWVLQLTMICCLLGYVRETYARETWMRAATARETGARETAARGTEEGTAAKGRTARGSAAPVPTDLILAGGAYLLSLAMKPTALVFSTAVFGMAGVYLLASKRLRLKAPLGCWCLILPEAAALIGIWARTFFITGMPVTSVFTGIFSKLGFRMKYPFAAGGLPQNFREENGLTMFFRRLYRMLLAPDGKDMEHVIIAWGTSLLFFLAAALAVLAVCRCLRRAGEQRAEDLTPEDSSRAGGAFRPLVHTVFWPFLAVNLVSLVMVYQVDGNYFILLYTMIILGFCAALSRVGADSVRRACLALLVPFAAFNVLLTVETNWAWSLGFTRIDPVNKGWVNHEAIQQEEMMRKGNVQIWGILSADPRTRVIAFGDHPACLAFPCNVQSYKDITAPWGNVELVNTPEAFAEYMEYAGTDYVYVEAGYIGESSWSWSYGLVRDLIADGTLKDLFFENGNVLARVDRDRASAFEISPDSIPKPEWGSAAGEPGDGESAVGEPGDGESAVGESGDGESAAGKPAYVQAQAARNLRLFDENYRTAEQQP